MVYFIIYLYKKMFCTCYIHLFQHIYSTSRGCNK